MKIVTVVRCFNEIKNIQRFINGYFFSDKIIISDGGSTDGSYEELLKWQERMPGLIKIIRFDQQKNINGELWNDDNPHMQYVFDAGKAENPDWLIYDDMDDIPNYHLRHNARKLLEESPLNQVNAFRLYMWGDKQYFPQMNDHFNTNFTSLWAWKPEFVNIHADQSQHHGTILGVTDHYDVPLPNCLLHKSWHPDTIQAKIDRYTKVGISMSHPFGFAGNPTDLPEWAAEHAPGEYLE